MKKLCFGSFATVLTLCKIQSVSQKLLCGTMLLSVATTYDITTDDNAVSLLLSCSRNLSPNVTDVVGHVDKNAVAAHFKDKVLPLLNPNKKSEIVLALKDIIASDESIKPDTVVELIGERTKADIAGEAPCVYHEFLAGLFLFVASTIANADGKDSVKEITAEYIKSFETSDKVVSFVSAYSKLSSKFMTEFAMETHTAVAMTTTGGNCQSCGRPLAVVGADGENNYAAIYHVSENEDTVLCVDCEREMRGASDEARALLLADKHSLDVISSARDSMSRHILERQIEEVLRSVDAMDVSEDTRLKTEPIKVERKITEKRLKERVLFDVTNLYNGVNGALDRLSGENKLNVDKFAKSIRRMFEDANDQLSQSEIYYLLVDMLFNKCGRKYKEACEIIISYFVQRCEVFNEIAE